VRLSGVQKPLKVLYEHTFLRVRVATRPSLKVWDQKMFGLVNVWVSEAYFSYWECLLFYVEHTEMYMNIIKRSDRINEVLY